MAQATSQVPIQVAVVGGGVCGLACAIALQRAGLAVELFEAAAAFTEVGAGIGLGPNAIRVLKEFGVLDAVLKKTNPGELKPKGFRFFSGLDGHELVYEYPMSPEDASISMHRAAFLDALVSAVDPRAAHFNKRCTSLSVSPANPARVVVHFADGTTHEADVVLGADGIRSTARDFVQGGVGTGPAFSNTFAYRGLIPRVALEAAGFKTDVKGTPACFMGPSKHIIVVPIKNGELINVAAFATRYDVPIGSQALPEGARWVEDVSRAELEKEYDGWGPDVAALLRCMPEKASRWAIHVVHPPLAGYARGRVALIGDAAHGMLPHLGAGASQGLEDAYVLVRLLSHPETNVDNLEAVLKAYSAVRQPRAQSVWDASYRAGSTYHLQGPHGATKEGLCEDLKDMWKPVWHYDFDSDVDTAVDSLRQSGAF
ncbi:FAD/NAD-P-binding domain-containing protein [Trametes versicolor FP-101664 SS1]|uniref:FAD/NAD-P-binding domain-containing protein n=1 Tax=Trametes versicolor (strain FP-101664) TaxID=717944 RepID=UPI0004621BD1|nr:FAD/NAD-P-binding domain-containing protein [Trametes versicolor FP-101664 SS1]EIW63965.1 FAD/NAD-P-binding domain-containing protein [Trametes versicolor FP-101664 SS1]